MKYKNKYCPKYLLTELCFNDKNDEIKSDFC